MLAVVALIILLAVVALGPSLPEGNAVRTFAESIREMMSGMGRGFGGGYQPINPAG